MRDKEIFNIFKDVNIYGFTFSKLQFSILPKDDIKVEDFDFDLIFTKEKFGIESFDLEVVGNVQLQTGENVKFKAPINLIRLLYEFREK